MKVSNVLRWIALPFGMLINALVTDNVVKWFLGILISNHELWEVISQSVSNVACGIIVVITSYHAAPTAKWTVMIATSIILVILCVAITLCSGLFVGDILSWKDWIVLLTTIPGPVIGYYAVIWWESEPIL